MSYVKYREDDIKINIHRMHMLKGSSMRQHKKTIRYFECKYCHQLFTGKAELIDHIRTAHNIVRPLIVINDKVIGDHTVLQYVREARVLMYGFDGQIRIGNHLLQSTDRDEIDITDILKSELTISPCCNIVFNNASVEIRMHTLSVDDNPKIKAVIDHWQKSASEGQQPDMSLLNGFIDGDLLYLQGVFNYYLACTAKHNKASRYDDAFSTLSQFNDLGGLGKCILKAIAFRRNWIDTLHLLDDGNPDIFSTACEFFDSTDSAFEYESDGSSNQLYVEDSTNRNLELIALHQKGQYDELRLRLMELGDIDDLTDLNEREQLYLLKGRLAASSGDYSGARRFYSQLITPVFREEYIRFANNPSFTG